MFDALRSVSIYYAPNFSHLRRTCVREGQGVSTTTLKNAELQDARGTQIARENMY
jgi:hypothetical protein